MFLLYLEYMCYHAAMFTLLFLNLFWLFWNTTMQIDLVFLHTCTHKCVYFNGWRSHGQECDKNQTRGCMFAFFTHLVRVLLEVGQRWRFRGSRNHRWLLRPVRLTSLLTKNQIRTKYIRTFTSVLLHVLKVHPYFHFCAVTCIKSTCVLTCRSLRSAAVICTRRSRLAVRPVRRARSRTPSS